MRPTAEMIRDIIRAETHCPVPKATQTWGNNYVHKTRGAFAMQVRKALNDESGLMPIRDLDFRQAGHILEQREKWCTGILPADMNTLLKRITIKAAAKVFDTKGNPVLLAAATDIVSGPFFFFLYTSATQ